MVVKLNFQITNEHMVKIFSALVDLSALRRELDFVIKIDVTRKF